MSVKKARCVTFNFCTPGVITEAYKVIIEDPPRDFVFRDLNVLTNAKHSVWSASCENCDIEGVPLQASRIRGIFLRIEYFKT